MWLRRSKTRARVHNAPSPKFACSSFKDVQTLFSPDDFAASAPGDGSGSPLGSPSQPSICHRTRSVKALLRTLSHHAPPPPDGGETAFPEIRVPGAADDSVVIYFTSLRVVRRTFEDCKAVRTILRAFRVPVDERDVSMDSAFMEELRRILAVPGRPRPRPTLPRVFIGGRYVGGVEEVRRLHESGELKSYMERLPAAAPGTCESCGGYRFILCPDCSGSHKCYSEKAGFRCCTSCNENGLVRCPSCSTAPL
ncbi:Glutaredoxin family protein [Striga hermonthica]|uniref:Glutaredoxin family protein n=1 Tax=Striga hermonthica TaxID=68872 RepID=A0A9N7MRQ8_STRHE|nr:Glutaredoxin family protein [Striga hermonthica]